VRGQEVLANRRSFPPIDAVGTLYYKVLILMHTSPNKESGIKGDCGEAKNPVLKGRKCSDPPIEQNCPKQLATRSQHLQAVQLLRRKMSIILTGRGGSWFELE
jgi:hypothetical protein